MSLLACQSRSLETEISSLKVPWAGIQASTSYFLAAGAPKEPLQTFTTL